MKKKRQEYLIGKGVGNKYKIELIVEKYKIMHLGNTSPKLNYPIGGVDLAMAS